MAHPSLGTLVRNSYESVQNISHGLTNQTVRLGVTGLSRSGKTVFITSLVRNLIAGGRLPFFSPLAEGRILQAYLEPQPDQSIPRFDYERHLSHLVSDTPSWPDSTKRISQLRLTIDYEPAGFWRRVARRRSLHVDIIDYPGEWLLDLSLLNKSYQDWVVESFDLADQASRKALACEWMNFTEQIDPNAAVDENIIIKGAQLFRRYLLNARSETHSFSTLPPGRFLMPGDLDGSPMLTFFPFKCAQNGGSSKSPYQLELEKRYNAYVQHVVKPFYRDYFARLDRQIVLVDALGSLNAGNHAVKDLEYALTSVLASFNQGKNSFLSSIFRPRIDRIVFAATKADHVHHSDHDRLERILGLLTERAAERAQFSGAEVKVIAMSAIRATQEAEVKDRGEMVPALIGIPLAGEHLGKKTFDGEERAAIFPGDLPEDPVIALEYGRGEAKSSDEVDMRFIRFRPPAQLDGAVGDEKIFPHIRLDHALEFLIGDKF